MGNPVLGVGTVVAFKKESVAGTRIAITAGDASNDFLDIISEGIDYIPVQHEIGPLAGARQQHGDFVFTSHHEGGGSLVIRPRHAHLKTIIELCLAALDGGTYRPSDNGVDLQTFTLEVLKAAQDEIALAGCKVNTATLRSSANSPLEIELDILAMSGERNPGDLASGNIVTLASEKPFMHGGLTMSCASEAWLGGATPQPVRSFELIFNNNLDGDAFCNSTDRQVIPVGVFDMTGTIELPYNSVTKAWWAEMIASSKVSFTMTYTDADANTMAIAIVAKLMGDMPNINETGNQWISVKFRGIYDGADADCVAITISV